MARLTSLLPRPLAVVSLAATLLTCTDAALTSTGLVIGATDNQSVPVAEPFYSAPSLNSVVLNVSLYDKNLTTPGYIFLAPYQVTQPGPYIFASDGTLIWDGAGVSGPQGFHDFRVCTYNGEDHLCAFQGNQYLGYSRGHGIILDSSYSIVKSVQTGLGIAAADQHEFKVQADGKSALLTSYDPSPYDLSAFNITGYQGWIMNNHFQEVSTSNNEVLFSWSAIDHVDPSESFVLPASTDVSGNGTSKDSAWDYFHINSVDKNAAGDYLVSSRHTETLYKISAKDGSIVWKLGGKASNFGFQGGLNFSYQHDARWISENSTTILISLFDNAFNGFNQSSQFSQGKLIALDKADMSASLVRAYGAPDPDGGLISASQGNVQTLNSTNVFIGWGANCFISETTADGKPVYYASFAQKSALPLQYRSYKFNFTSNPSTAPSLYVYARNQTASSAYYMSWNGATEVSSWRIYGGADKSPANMSFIGNVRKTGFETVATYTNFYPYSIVEAIANNGTGLRNSTVVTTFVPGAALNGTCSDIQCPLYGGFEINPDVQILAMNTVAPTVSPTFILGAATSTTSSAALRNVEIPEVGKAVAVVLAGLTAVLSW